ncbi:MAG: PA2779 family protein, partial [Candidatus Omnitrophota bacterium]
AGLVESKRGIEEERSIYLEKIKAFLEGKIVKSYLNRFGMDKDVLMQKIEKLQTDELKELALRCDKVKVGGSSGAFIVILVLLLLIFVVLYVTNYTIRIEPRDAVPRRY